MHSRVVDVVGLGLNATDRVMVVRKFPAPGTKERVLSVSQQAGGQVATALMTCARLGLRARYIGRVGDDAAGSFQLASLRGAGLDLRGLRVVRGARTLFSNIIVDQTTGERTIFWERDARLTIPPQEVRPETILRARALLVDGCDFRAALAAARLAKRAGIPIIADFDTVHSKLEKLFPFIDYLIASTHFLPAVTGEADPFRVLEFMQREYGIHAPGMTLGQDGALIYSGDRFYYSPGFVVDTLDTTGAGDVFHGAFIFGLLRGWAMERILDFSNAMAGMNCAALGARGGIRSERAAWKLLATGRRHRNPAYVLRARRAGRGNS